MLPPHPVSFFGWRLVIKILCWLCLTPRFARRCLACEMVARKFGDRGCPRWMATAQERSRDESWPSGRSATDQVGDKIDDDDDDDETACFCWTNYSTKSFCIKPCALHHCPIVAIVALVNWAIAKHRYPPRSGDSQTQNASRRAAAVLVWWRSRRSFFFRRWLIDFWLLFLIWSIVRCHVVRGDAHATRSAGQSLRTAICRWQRRRPHRFVWRIGCVAVVVWPIGHGQVRTGSCGLCGQGRGLRAPQLRCFHLEHSNVWHPDRSRCWKRPKQLPTMPWPLQIPPEPAMGGEGGCYVIIWQPAAPI